jgi:curved DNA-binding protein CbpA
MTQEDEDIFKCYELLEVDPGASFSDVKRAYREMCKVWHPDRFEARSKLRLKAQEKLKQINLAFARLEEFYSESDEEDLKQASLEKNAQRESGQNETQEDVGQSSGRIPEKIIQQNFNRKSPFNSAAVGWGLILCSLVLLVLKGCCGHSFGN